MAEAESDADILFFKNNQIEIFVGSVLGISFLGGIIATFITKIQSRQRPSPSRLAVVITLIGLGVSHSTICLYSIWNWFVERNRNEDRVALWPYILLPLLTGILIGGVHIEMAYRGYLASNQQDPTLPVIVGCLAVAEIVFGLCRLIELNEKKDLAGLNSRPAIYSFWISCVLISDISVIMYTWYSISHHEILIGLEGWAGKLMFIFLSTHCLTSLVTLIGLILFFTTRSSYAAIDLCLANLHVISLMIGTDSSSLNCLFKNAKTGSNGGTSGSLIITNLEVGVPMGPLSSRFRPSRQSDEWEETFATESEFICEVRRSFETR
ncbi:hypothetical protein CROQUDRAFT_673721 [Cronartium quercuum f. sp. fusiforme G11]|uniref:Uncharacterized protein n=1 Tax=Cronartium quercuum f. sp. fusiforme G11 TaxID=708437 RepID=A0A9P6N8Y1_9BASI|nr:hypothetical protein CROQUDRAFT_673721 [Cronartium quercuum f. sp. fusiforme G11]